MSEQVKFLAGLKDQLTSKAGTNELVVGALYFCTDEKKIFKATANNAYEAVNEEVKYGALPEIGDAFPGKLYLRQSDMTLHVKDGNAWKQLSAPANALVPDNVSDDLNADDSKLLASKAAVKAGIKVVADKLDKEISDRATAEAQLLVDAKAYADQKDTELKGDYNTAGEGQPSNASGLRKEIEERIAAEAKLRSDADKGLADRLDKIEGTGEGSIKAAVKTEADRAKGEEARIEGLVTTEKSARIEADTALDTRITKLEGDANTPGSVASQIKNVQDQVNDIKNKVGAPAVEADEENHIEAQDATGLFKEIADEKAARVAKDTELTEAIATEKSRATAAEEANKAAIEAEKTRAMAAEKANADAITVLNGADTVEGSVKKQIKDAVGAEAALRLEKDNELQGAIDNIEEALGLGEGTGATGSVGNRLTTLETEMDAVEGRATALEERATNLETAVNVLKGNAETEGSVAKAVKDAVDAEKSAREQADNLLDGRLDVIEASIGTGGDLEKRVKANEDAIKVINGEEEGSIKKAVADLVGGAPAAMDTLKELADAISTHQGVYEAYVQTVSTELAKKVDKVDGSRLVAETEVTKWNAKAEVSDVNQALVDAKSYTDEKVGDLTSLATDAKGSAVLAINELKGNINTINDVDNGILAKAKEYTNGKVGDLNDLETTEHGSAVLAINELKGTVDKINADLGLEGATGTTASIKDRLNSLESVVGDAEGGLVKEVADLKTADTALGNRLTTVEGVVGNEQSGLVKDVADNAAAIEAINHETTGILAQAKADATTKANAAKDAAIEKAGELDAALKTEIEKDGGVLMTAIKTEENRAIGVENGLKTRLEAVEKSIGDGGDLELRVDAVEAQAAANKAAIGDASSGLTKKVNDNTANIAANTAAIEAINNVDTGILAQAKADATTKANTAQANAEAKAAELDTALETKLKKYADDAEADALASAKEYVDEKIGTASVPGEGEAQGTAATGLHKVIEDKDAATLAAAKTYADTAADKATTEALTWGTF